MANIKIYNRSDSPLLFSLGGELEIKNYNELWRQYALDKWALESLTNVIKSHYVLEWIFYKVIMLNINSHNLLIYSIDRVVFVRLYEIY